MDGALPDARRFRDGLTTESMVAGWIEHAKELEAVVKY